jgi:hypothetical protein
MFNVNVICSYSNQPQDFFDIKVPILKEAFVLASIFNTLKPQQIANLEKISMAVDVSSIPQWLEQSQGKYYFGVN